MFGRIGQVFLPIGIGLLVLAGIAALLLGGPALIAVTTTLGVLGLVGAIQGATFLGIQRHFFGSVADLKQVAATGHQTVATIVNVHRTMSRIGSEPVVRLDLTVGGHAVTRHVLVPFNHTADVRPGAELPVRVDPGDPRTMIIEWHRLVGQGQLTDGTS